jgi:hypothetical protein
VSIAKRIGSVAVAVAVLATATATAHAATSARTPVATVRAYVAALGRHDAEGACALVDPRLVRSRSDCSLDRATFRGVLRARIEPGALIRGTRARVVVDLVVDYDPQTHSLPLSVSRSRLLLRLVDGRWRIAATAGRPLQLVVQGSGPVVPDPAPAGTAAALRRLADDELLALSGNAPMLCDLLRRGVLPSVRDECERAFPFDSLDAAGSAVRLAGLTAHLTAPGRARLEITAVATRAVRSTSRPGYALRARRWSDTVHAVRSGGRWKLVKPSRSFYRTLGLSPPADVDAPSATAVWPAGDMTVPSLSERATPPECRTPPLLWGPRCSHFDGLGAGAGLVAWSAGSGASARPVAAGAAAGSVAALPGQERGFSAVTGIAPVGDGALVIETSFGDLATRAVPVGRDGRPRGPVQPVDEGRSTTSDNDVGERSVVVPMPGGAAGATVLTATRIILRLDADGRPTGPVGTLATGLDIGGGLLVARPDGTLLWFGAGPNGDGIAVTALDAGGNVVAAPATQTGAGAPLGTSFAAAEDAAGRMLVGWVEEGGGRRTLRTWLYDPAAPGSTTPVSRAGWPSARTDDADRVDVTALPDGGWGLAWSAGAGVWADRLPSSGGAWVARPRRVAASFLGTHSGARGFALAGDTVAWIAPPAVAGLSQVRSTPLP